MSLERPAQGAFGNWNKVYKRFNAWSAAGKWFKVFKMLVAEPDMEWVFIDGSYAKAHQHSAGAASANDEAISRQYQQDSSGGGRPWLAHRV
jgi:transposase